ncbi:MAG: hypothetical protein JKY52_16050 [Flavobacteriales bacterium]|nr:hypothetical protein [Flavobacteriales bacterium]
MLSKNWITENNLDNEYKRYVLAGYLKKVSDKFDKSLLFPHLKDLEEHVLLLKELKEIKRGIQSRFPQSLTGLDWQKMGAKYSEDMKESSMMHAIQEILDHAIPRMNACLNDGNTIYDFFKGQLFIETIGIEPLYEDEGYLLLLNIGDNCTMAYRYNITIFDYPGASYKKVNTVYVGSYKSSITNTEARIKRKLVKENAELPNPATYSIKTDIPIPFYETMLPLAKHVLMEHLERTPM